MTYFPFWVGGLALALVAALHWFLLRRSLAVSGRITSLVNRVRHGPEPELPMSMEELVAAAAAVTAKEFGPGVVPPPPTPPQSFRASNMSLAAVKPLPPATNALWFLSLVAGGAAVRADRGGLQRGWAAPRGNLPGAFWWRGRLAGDVWRRNPGGLWHPHGGRLYVGTWVGRGESLPAGEPGGHGVIFWDGSGNLPAAWEAAVNGMNILMAGVGVLMGFSLSRIGFSSYDELHRMFTFADLRLLLTFMSGVGALAAVWLVARALRLPAPNDVKPIQKGTILGGVLFGVGWAVCGACPGIAFVQVGEGQLGALVTIAGMFVGNAVFSVLHEKVLHWDVGSCE